MVLTRMPSHSMRDVSLCAYVLWICHAGNVVATLHQLLASQLAQCGNTNDDTVSAVCLCCILACCQCILGMSGVAIAALQVWCGAVAAVYYYTIFSCMSLKRQHNTWVRYCTQIVVWQHLESHIRVRLSYTVPRHILFACPRRQDDSASAATGLTHTHVPCITAAATLHPGARRFMPV